MRYETPQKGRRVEIGQHLLRLIQTPDENKTTNLKISRMRRVQPVPVLFQRHPCCMKRFRRPAQVARGQRNLGFGDDAPRACHGFFWTKGPSRLPQEFPRPYKLSELRHRDAAKRQRRRIIAQRDSFQCAEGIACGQSARCGCD